MDVNFEYYKIFYYVAKYHNFTKAAQALNNSQPNITRAMNCLEQQLNTTLFIRTNRGVQLTPEGERLYIHVLSAMEQFQAAEEELADSSGLSHGSVAIGASETALNIFLLDKLKSFHITYPGIRLRLYNHSTPEAIESVKSGKIDFAVVSTPAEVDFPLKQIMLMPFQEILVGGTTFTALGSQELSLREVKNYPMISLGRETMTYKFYNSVFLSHGLDLSPDTIVFFSSLAAAPIGCWLSYTRQIWRSGISSFNGICTISFFKREGVAIGWGKKASPSSHFTRGRI